MTIEQVETFLMIIETKNISEAGKKLFISQSTVSHRVTSLEKELNCILFIRTRGERYVRLSLKGEEFIEIAKRWKSLWIETNLWKTKESKLNLKIASVDSINTSIFANFYKNIIKKNSNLSLNISSHWSDTIYTLIENYSLDMGFVLKPLKYQNITVKPIFKGRGVLVSLKDSNYNSLIHPEELDTKDEILFSSIYEYSIWHNSWWEELENQNLSVDTVSLLFSILDSKKQWCIIPIWIANAFKDIYPIKISELSVTPPEYTCYEVFNKNPRPSKVDALKLFSEKLDDFLKSHDFMGILK